MLILSIKVAMSVALIFYFLAFAVAKKLFKTHVILALVGFGIDIVATIAMELARIQSGLVFDTYSLVLQFHTIVSAVALMLFLVQLALGILKMGRLHVIFAEYLFLPLWVIAFLSGMYLIF